MIDLRANFMDRVGEVDAYVNLVEALEHAVQSGIPLLTTTNGESVIIVPLQQKILYAGVYLHLYNLVEATISGCIVAVEKAASAEATWNAGDLSAELRAEWVRTIARTHEPLNTQHRLEAAIKLCDHVVSVLPVKVKIDIDGGGNWDDVQIHRFAKRVGIPLAIDKETETGVKRKIREDKGALQLIKHLRNKLAHGEMSFSECGEGQTVGDLMVLKRLTVAYLLEVIRCFEGYIRQHEFLSPGVRPAANAD